MPEAAIFHLTPEDIATLSPTDLAARLAHRPGTLGERMGIMLLEAGPERLVATLPVEGNRQPAGRLHGGASAALAEELASIGSWLNLDIRREVAVGVDLNITHVRGATGGEVRGVAERVYRGRSVLVWTVSIFNEHGKLTSTARCTCNVVRV
ncbi:PaaI family thioesterase [Deinococcus sp. KNUC1210]|uniref:PaaI family thioesterase n=1 Tax=Deinococcus sp. KNUC1210 TaxID=2917691 RepID=UPI001EF131F6|nr:PaaI family thioesterase [Deinococcus sp. KNUC1210]ULH15224.1 PaaI family thioesterase [Deinococcus sp. KNUC1210]